MINLYHDDCFNIFPQLEDNSIDLVLCDMPYGTTACKWDTVIDLERMWAQLKRVVKPNIAIVLTATQPFTSVLVCSNLKMFKYQWIWEKTKATNFFAAKFQPLNNTEDILVFSTGGCNNGTKHPVVYNPQGVINIDRLRENRNTGGALGREHKTSMTNDRVYKQTITNYPFKTLKFKHDVNNQHPTQKPVALMEYLIKTYSKEGDTVLDFCMGSGTTGVACKNLNRNFIGVEKDENYFNTAKNRITSI